MKDCVVEIELAIVDTPKLLLRIRFGELPHQLIVQPAR
jgi:hypothetical protein